MDVDYDVALEIACHEAVIRQAYKDSEGVWTWSVGLTNATGHNVQRYIDNPQSLEKCFSVYAWALNNYADAVRAEFAGHPLTKPQFAGALSFHWNTGAIKSATWPDLFKAGKIAEARASFLSWKKPAAIEERRKKEAALFFDGVWSNDGQMTEYTALTAAHAPKWSSAVSINVGQALGAAFASMAPADVEQPISDASLADRVAALEAAVAALKAAA